MMNEEELIKELEKSSFPYLTFCDSPQIKKGDKIIIPKSNKFIESLWNKKGIAENIYLVERYSRIRSESILVGYDLWVLVELEDGRSIKSPLCDLEKTDRYHYKRVYV